MLPNTKIGTILSSSAFNTASNSPSASVNLKKEVVIDNTSYHGN